VVRDVERALGVAFVVASALLAAALVLVGLGHPLLWNDEADTAVLAGRVAEHGYPKAHGEPELLYNLDPSRIHPRSDAYLGGLWGAYYLGAPGAAWAASRDEPHAKTWRMRLPFALVGCVGLLWAGLAVLPAFRGPRARLLFLGLYGLAIAYSVSLLLHVREARWYAPALCWVAGLVALHLRRQVFRRGGRPGHTLGVAALLFLLFNTFHPAFVAVGVALALDLLWRARRISARERLGWLAREALPLALAVALCLPVALVFDLPGLTLSWTGFLSGVARSYAENLAFVLRGSLRYEFLAPALLARLAVAGLTRRGATSQALRQRSQIASFVWWLAIVYAAVICRSPLVWERYLIPLSPWISLALLLDGASLLESLRTAAPGRSRLLGRVAALPVAAALVVVLGLRWPELAGRLAELGTPVRGPLDHAIPHLRNAYPDPRSLVIATNYEGPAYSFYLGSEVIVGYYAGNLAEDARRTPDVIVHRPWPRFGDLLLAMTRRAAYTATRFPVRNTPTNSGPALWQGTPGGRLHLFATPATQEAAQQLVLLERVRPAPGAPRERD
jgi:hypothetical protein